MAYDVDLPDRDSRDVVPSFEQAAHTFGCKTSRIRGRELGMAGGWATRVWSGVTATCDDGRLALVAVTNTRVRIGCERPTTRDRCDALLRKITALP